MKKIYFIIFIIIIILSCRDKRHLYTTIECKLFKKYEQKNGYLDPNNQLSFKDKDGYLIELEDSILYNNYEIGDKFELVLYDLTWHITNIHLYVKYSKYKEKSFMLDNWRHINE